MALFKRAYVLTLGTRQITDLKMRFRVEKDIKKTPNTCTLDIFNLSEASRLTYEKDKVVPIQLDVGYEGQLETIYLGQVRTANSVINGPDIITHFEAGDGQAAIQQAKIAQPVGPGTTPGVVLRNLAQAMGVGTGNVESAITRLNATGKALFPTGKVLTGSAATNMEALCRSVGLEFSIQDGKLQILNKGKALNNLAFELSSDTGLVGSPTVDSKGIVNAQTFFTPGMKPGSKVMFKSRFINGGYRISKCTYTGDSWTGSEWFIELEAEKLK
jgi:hypothetical protein